MIGIIEILKQELERLQGMLAALEAPTSPSTGVSAGALPTEGGPNSASGPNSTSGPNNAGGPNGIGGASSCSAGSLYVVTRKQQAYYYMKDRERDRKTRYLGKKDSEEVRAVKAQKVGEQCRAVIRHDCAVLKKTIEDLIPTDLRTVCNMLPAVYAGIPVDLGMIPGISEGYREALLWAKEKYPRNPAPFLEGATYALDGTRVRSKGECIWYNILLMLGIPFRYDAELEMYGPGGEIVRRYPDFMIRCLDGSIIVIEHLGLLKKQSYRLEFAEKTYLYQINGYVLGESFFLTSDEKNGGTNAAMIREVAEFAARRFYQGRQRAA